MHKNRIKNFIYLSCGAPQFELTLKLSELGGALQALQDEIERPNILPGQQLQCIRSAMLRPWGLISCTNSQYKDSTYWFAGDDDSNLYLREYYVTTLIRYLAKKGDQIQDLKCLGIKKIWIQGDDIHIQGTNSIVDTIESNLHKMNMPEEHINFIISSQSRRIVTGPCSREGLKCLSNVWTGVLGVGSLASLTVAIIALVGLISLPMSVVGIGFAVCVALGTSAAYSYYVTRAKFNRELPIEHIDLTRFGDGRSRSTPDAHLVG